MFILSEEFKWSLSLAWRTKFYGWRGITLRMKDLKANGRECGGKLFGAWTLWEQVYVMWNSARDFFLWSLLIRILKHNNIANGGKYQLHGYIMMISVSYGMAGQTG